MKATKQIDIYLIQKRNVRVIDVVQYDTGIQLVFNIKDLTVTHGSGGFQIFLYSIIHYEYLYFKFIFSYYLRENICTKKSTIYKTRHSKMTMHSKKLLAMIKNRHLQTFVDMLI